MAHSETDILFMRRCLQLAACGLGRVRPNPMVGSVIVKDGRIVSEGFHQYHGGWHAERNAILKAENGERKTDVDLRGATLYVNLEPCSHQGLTPPCADLIVEKGIGRVVCCNDDPNPLVSGRGFAKLEAAGIEVVRHVLEDEGRELNRRFFTFFEKKRPFIILKWAETADGYMAPLGENEEDNGTQGSPLATDASCHKGANALSTKSYWISSESQNRLNHRWRTEEAAILVGSQTFIDDRPQLTARHFVGLQPIPVVLDRRGRLQDVPEHWLHLQCQSLQEAMGVLFERKIQSLIVEGGRRVLDAFIAEGLYDEVRILRGNARFGKGLPAPTIPPISDNRLHINS